MSKYYRFNQVDDDNDYADKPYEEYHFDKGKIQEGDYFVYRKSMKRKGKPSYYFGAGQVGKISETGLEKGKYIAHLIDVREFANKVPLKMSDGTYVEKYGCDDKKDPAFTTSVVEITKEAFDKIIELSKQGTNQPPHPFNQNEAILLLEEYLQSQAGNITQKIAIDFVSKTCRAKAVELGYTFDDSYRSVSGITNQFHEIATSGTELFKATVAMRKDDTENYIQLMEDTITYFHIDADLAAKWRANLPKKQVGMDMEPKVALQIIKSYIKYKGFSYEDDLIDNLYLSLKAKPFVILAGTSGTGKTRLVKLFAEAIGATSKKDGGNGRFLLVPVRPDWSDSSDLFGHLDLDGNFVEGPVIEFLKEANIHTEYPYFLCLDEMNLARVEYYLSDYLSVVETRDWHAEEITTEDIITEKMLGTKSKYEKMSLPSNLYVIGTVNMDETTFPFSKKVLDRANTIEFNYVDLKTDFKNQGQIEKVEPIQDLSNSFLQAQYLKLQDCAQKLTDEVEYVDMVCGKLADLNNILKTANAHVGYRVRDEIAFYMAYNHTEKLISEEKALDNCILQKILPRINGSSDTVMKLLDEIYIWLTNPDNKFAASEAGTAITQEGNKPAAKHIKDLLAKDVNFDDELEKAVADCDYKNSARKVAKMYRRAKDDGFVSYWF